MNLNMLKEWLPLMAAVVGLLVGVKLLVANPIEARLDRMENRLSQRLNHIEAEMSRRFDTMQTENQRQHDEIKDVLRIFERRITRLEENAGIRPETTD